MRWRQFAWLVAIWSAGVAALALVAYILRIGMQAVGLTA